MEKHDIIATMVNRAGITVDISTKSKVDHTFDAIVEGMIKIHESKQVLYGNYIETHGKDPELFALMEHFCDIKRKYVRAEHYMKRIMIGEHIDKNQLFDTYSDMAVYAAMGIQLLIHLEERNEQTSSSDRVDKSESSGEWSGDAPD